MEERLNAARAVGLLLGVAADSMLGPPVRRRPVGEPGLPPALSRWVTPAGRGGMGGVHAGALLAAAVLVGVAAERVGRRGPLLQAIGTGVATWAVLGGASLAAEGTAVARALDASDLATARRRLPYLSSRDPSTLDGAGLARAAVESVAENTSDVVVAPLLWGAVAGVPGLLGHRVVRALESGATRHGRTGWALARLDDAANLVPSRAAAALTAVCAPVVGGSAPGAWEVWRRDGSAHPRANVGQVEAAFAGALEVRLGGRLVDPHGVQERPVLGHGRTPDAGDLTRGVELSRVVGVAAAVSSALLAGLVGLRRSRRRGTR
jgi:adenosylcobinamide-phosphate synthase